MSKVIKISDSTSLKLKELMKALEETGCSEVEKVKARKIFKIYLDGRAEINEWKNYYDSQANKIAYYIITYCWMIRRNLA